MVRISFLLVFLLSTAALATPSRKPGLWEVRISANLQGPKPQLTPAQAAQLKKMGVAPPWEKPMVVKHCLSAEEAAQNTPPPMAGSDSKTQCEHKNLKKSGKTVSLDVVCKGERPVTGKVELTILDDSHYIGTTVMNGVNPEGKPAEIRSQYEARWLAAKCE